MDEDRYYNLGSHDKLFNQIDELTDALASRDAEIESLRKQLAYKQSVIDGWLYANGPDGWIESLRQQLSDSQKREVMLRGFVKLLRDYIPASAVGNMTVQEALAATANLDGLILCHAEPFCHLTQTSSDRNPPHGWSVTFGSGEVQLYRAWEPK